MNEERSAVAKRLSELISDDFDDGEFYDRGEVEDALGLVTDDGSWYDAAGVRRLADLIEPEPERTCRMIYDDVHGDYVCSACGEWHNTGKYDACDADDNLVFKPYKFCPSCGARVVGE